MPNSLKSHIETLREMFAVAANERRMKEADALAAAIESLSRQGGEAVAYCNPSDPHARDAFSWPGTDRKPDHNTPLFARASEAGDCVDAARYRWIEKHADVEYIDADGNGWICPHSDPHAYSLASRVDKAIAAAPAPGGDA